MNAPTLENLDLACARIGKTIAENPSKEIEKLITSALGVLEEQGLYALFLYLKAQGKDMGNPIIKELQEFLQRTPQNSPLLQNNANIFNSLQNLGKSLDSLLLARDLLRQALVYARYHAKLKDDQKKEQES